VGLWSREGHCSAAIEHDYEHLYMNYDNSVSMCTDTIIVSHVSMS